MLALPSAEDWTVRVIPNLYPAFQQQEVVIHSPRHARSVGELTDGELDLVAEAWRTRATSGSGYVHALVNEGRDAGSSLPHSHSQLVWFPEAPPEVARETGLSLDGETVLERDGLVLFCPRASRAAYELAIAPAEAEPDAWASELLAPALRLLAEAVRRLVAVTGPLPLNAWLHNGAGHWHLEVLPRLSVLAGIELGAGWYVNTLAPEAAAEALKGEGRP